MAVSRARVWRSRQPRDAHRLFWVTVPSPNGEWGTQVLVVSVRLGTPSGFFPSALEGQLSGVPWRGTGVFLAGVPMDPGLRLPSHQGVGWLGEGGRKFGAGAPSTGRKRH